MRETSTEATTRRLTEHLPAGTLIDAPMRRALLPRPVNRIVFDAPDSDRSPQTSDTSTPARHAPFGAFSERLTCTVTVVDDALGGGRDGADLGAGREALHARRGRGRGRSREQQHDERGEEDEGVGVRIT